MRKILKTSELNFPLRFSRKVFHILKIAIVVMLVGTLSAHAGNGEFKNKVTINLSNTTLDKVLAEIERQTDYLFVYNKSISVNQQVSVRVKDELVTVVLDNMLKNTNIEYSIESNHILLKEKTSISGSKQQSKKKVTIEVLDEYNEPLIGVAVSVKGTTAGAYTDVNGKITLDVAQGAILTLTYVGYKQKEMTVSEANTYKIPLEVSDTKLDDVIVTALGIKREEKTLTYNVQQIKADELTAVPQANLINSLAGKVAGVTINQSSSGVGGSTRVVMRGTKSLYGQNNVLYVVDGLPMTPIRSKQSENFYEGEDEGDFEGISMLNPDDIESMNVLMGASASALYGNEGANGVILITTKKGKEGRVRVNYSNSTTFANPFVMPKFQQTYGKSADPTSYASWGDKLSQKSSYDPKDFFQTAYTLMNSLAISGGNELSTYHASFGATNARDLIPNNKYERYNFRMRNSTNLIKDVLTMDASILYISQKDQNPATANLYYNPLVPIYLFSPGEDINRYRVFETYDFNRNFKTQYWPYENQSLDGLKQNPYWIRERNLFNNKRDRYMFNMGFNYKVNDWLNAAIRGRLDRFEMKNQRSLYASTHTQFSGKYGNYRLKKSTSQNIYADALLSVDKTFGDDFRLTANLGGSFKDNRSESTFMEGDLLEYANKFHLLNLDYNGTNFKKGEGNLHTRTNSAFATVQFGYKNYAFLDLSSRIDYFSTMEGADNNTIAHYPSVGLSSILTDIIPMSKDVLSFMKVRASYAFVGNPLDAYLTRLYYEMGQGLSSSSFKPADNLKEERTKSFEVGTDIKLLGNKVTIGATYYNQNTTNQLIQYEISAATGYSTAFANAGKVNNQGVEVLLGYNQKIGPVEWNSNITYSFNKNKVTELPDFLPDGFGGMQKGPEEYKMSDVNGAYQMKITQGGTMSDIYIQTIKRDPNGYIYVDPGTGAIQTDPTMVYAGQAAPRYNVGFSNGFSWKGFALNFLIDARVGGVVVSSTQALLDQYGVSEASAAFRDAGGVPVNGGRLDTQAYFQTIAGGTTGTTLGQYTYSATNARLRELSLAYQIPPKLFKNKLDITLSVTGRNLIMFYNRAPFDPELTSNTGTYYQGYDYFMQPSQRSFGFGIKVGL